MTITTRSNRKPRECDKCGRVFCGTNNRCFQCSKTSRNCVTCGREFIGAHRNCSACQKSVKQCTKCGRTSRTHHAMCNACSRSKDRRCTECGTAFTGIRTKCVSCRRTLKMCPCGTVFRGEKNKCYPCRTTVRICLGCGSSGRREVQRCGQCWWAETDIDIRTARNRSKSHARRARLAMTAVIGPLPAKTYLAVMRSGPCVYCGAPAEHADHITPLARGGIEHLSNLAPACGADNMSKGAKLLTEWEPVKVAHAVRTSPTVAHAFALLTAGISPIQATKE